MLVVQNLSKVNNETSADEKMSLLYQKEQSIPGAIEYSIKRYHANLPMELDETGMMEYHFQAGKPDENYLKLKYCSTGNRYCDQKSCEKCKIFPAGNCREKIQTADVFTFHFTQSFLGQFTPAVTTGSRKDEVLVFKHPASFIKTFPICHRKRGVLDSLLNHNYAGSLENIFVNAKIHELLLYSLECLVDEKEETFSCKFLANDLDREKILYAKEVLLQHIGDPITIKELSRKGTTIFDFYQQQRMEHAKYLLYEKGLSVTDVSAILGYSSISHFSTAFKKHTGLKPCELLTPVN
jgi:AraC family transcriptional regulator